MYWYAIIWKAEIVSNFQIMKHNVQILQILEQAQLWN